MIRIILWASLAPVRPQQLKNEKTRHALQRDGLTHENEWRDDGMILELLEGPQTLPGTSF